jgi:hypothetical protein
MDRFAFAVAVALYEDGKRAVELVLPLYFIGDECRGLVPGNSLVFALAAVLCVPLAVGVEVHSE